jgi:hypothetical protein
LLTEQVEYKAQTAVGGKALKKLRQDLAGIDH